MLEDGRFEPVVITTSTQGAEAVRSATTPELRTVWLDGTPHACSRKNGRESIPAGDVRRNASHRLKHMLLKVEPLHTPILWRGLGADLHAASDLVDRVQPAAVAVFSDRTPRPEMALLHAARRANVPTVLLPFAASTQESDAFVRRDAMSLRLDRGPLAPVCRVFARRNPRHAMDSVHGRMLFFSLWDSLALAGRGLHRTSPWVVGGGDVDIVAVASAQDFDKALSHGIPREGLRMTGQASLDSLHRSWSRRGVLAGALDASYGLRPDRPLAVCAVPHLAEHGLRRWSDHEADTRDLFQALADSGAEVLLSLHPKSESSVYRELAGRYGLRIAKKPLRDMLPAADMFVAGFSSTVRWAAVLGIPTVVFDPARIGYRMYDDLRSVPKLTNATELARELSSLAGDSEARARRAAELRPEGRRLGMVDGKACARIVEVFAELATAKRQGGLQAFGQ